MPRPLAWQLGRVLAYGVLGALVGGVGGVGLELLTPAWASTALAIGLALSLGLAAVRLWRAEGGASAGLVPLGRRSRGSPVASRLLARAPRSPFVLGAVTALLPCGALWAALLVAASAGSSLGGAMAMVGFAAASGVVLVVASSLLARGLVDAPLGGRRTIAAALALGAVVMLIRPVVARTSEAGEPPACHVQ